MLIQQIGLDPTVVFTCSFPSAHIVALLLRAVTTEDQLILQVAVQHNLGFYGMMTEIH